MFFSHGYFAVTLGSVPVLPYRASQGLRYGYNFYNMSIKEDYDVLNPHISPSEWIRHKNKRVVWFCHSPPREVYDLFGTRMASRSHRDKVLYSTMANVYKFIASGITKKIEQIVTNSENTRQRINKYYSRDATVVNPGINYHDFRNDGDSRYFLYPSRILVNKRQDYIIQAFKQFTKSIRMFKHSEPMFNEKDRLAVVKALRFVDEAYLGERLGGGSDMYSVLKKFNPDVIALGYDQRADINVLREWACRRRPNARVVRIRSVLGRKRYKSSKLKRRMRGNQA